LIPKLVKRLGKLRMLIWSNALLVMFIAASLVWSVYMNWQVSTIKKLSRENAYNNLAGSFVEYYADQKASASFIDIKTTIKLLNKIVPEYFKDNEFKVDDFLALAILESHFNKRCVGTRGERGMFQILDWKGALEEINDPLGDAFDIGTNIRMSCLVLKHKYEERKTYKDSIIAYNGYIIQDGKVVEKYWHNFTSAQKLVNKIKERAKKL